MKYPKHKNEIPNESARHPYEITMKYPRHKNEISNESARHPYEIAMKYLTSPLSLRRDSFITPDIEDFFSVLTLNFAFLPRKLMVSHTQEIL